MLFYNLYSILIQRRWKPAGDRYYDFNDIFFLISFAFTFTIGSHAGDNYAHCIGDNIIKN